MSHAFEFVNYPKAVEGPKTKYESNFGDNPTLRGLPLAVAANVYVMSPSISAPPSKYETDWVYVASPACPFSRLPYGIVRDSERSRICRSLTKCLLGLMYVAQWIKLAARIYETDAAVASHV
jgi:hypothetical protein